DRSFLGVESLPKLGGQYANAGETLLVEIVQVMRGTRRARSAIRQRDDYCIAIFGDVPDHLARSDPRISRFLVSAGLDSAFGAKLLETVDELVAAHLSNI